MIIKTVKSIIKKIISYFGYSINKINTPKTTQRLEQINIKHFFDLYFSMINPSDFFFVQIGANDGKTRDPINEYISKYQLRGILVEPQPDVFERLIDTYQGNNNVILVNSAISESVGKKKFYTSNNLLKKNYPDLFFRVTGLASFDRDTVKKSLAGFFSKTLKNKEMVEKVDDYIEEIEVKTTTLYTLFKENNVGSMDFLFIDCEGYDFEIIKFLDFNKFKPKIINYESLHLKDDDVYACEQLLSNNGYTFFRHGNDTCAFLN